MIRGKVEKVHDNLNLDLNVGIHNRFDIEVIDANTGKVKQKAQAFNVICNTLWNAVINGSSSYNRNIAYGRGSGTPSETDTTLFDQIASTQSTFVSTNTDYEHGVFKRTRYLQLSTNTAVGETITEVGIANGNTVYTHAMLEDMNGNPISITKTNTDVINIYATVFVHFSETGYSNGGIFLMSGSKPFNLFDHLAGMDYNYEDFVAWGATNSLTWRIGTSNSNTAHYSLTQVTGASRINDLENKTITIKFPRLEASSHNYIGGIKTFCISGGGKTGTDSNLGPYPYATLVVGGDWWPYTQVNNEAVGTGDGETTDFSLKFDDAHDITVLVDGVEEPNVTLDYGPVSTNGIWYHMVAIHPSSTIDHIVYGPTFNSDSNFQGTRMIYNPYFELGIKSIYISGQTVSCSDDLVHWYQLTSSTVPEEHRHKRYWKSVCNTSTSASGIRYFPYSMVFDKTFNGKALHFENPPRNGAVITASYKADVIGKDADHVFDLSVTFKFTGYTAL